MKKIFLILLLFGVQTHASYKLALNWKPEPQFGGFYEAERAGFFKEANLDVQILEGGSGTPTVQMLANGKVDFAIVSAEEILILNDRGPKNKVVGIFAAFQTNPQIIMTHESRRFKNIGDVFRSPGILAIQSGLSYAQFLLKKYGKPVVKIVPYAGGITNFLKDNSFSQQGFLTSEPLAAEKAGAKVKTFLVAEEGFNPYTTVVAVRKDFLDKNKDKVEAFTKAVRKGWEQYLSDPDATNQVMWKKNKSLDQETFRKSAQAQKDLIKYSDNFTVGSMSEERWQNLIRQMLDLKLIKHQIPADQIFINF